MEKARDRYHAAAGSDAEPQAERDYRAAEEHYRMLRQRPDVRQAFKSDPRQEHGGSG